MQKFLDDPHNNPASTTSTTALPENTVQMVLAAAEATTLTPEGLNRITIDDQNITHSGLDAVRAPAGTPIVVARVGGLWRIRYGNVDICGNGCSGQSVQLHFATDTAVAVSTTGRSYSHGRINLIAQGPGRFWVTLDSMTIEKFFADPHSALPTTSQGTPPTTPEPVVEPPPQPVHPEDSIRVHLSTTTSTRLTPQGANPHHRRRSGATIQVPAGSSVTVTRNTGHWHFTINGNDVCGGGCVGNTAQLHFATGTSVAVSQHRSLLLPRTHQPGSLRRRPRQLLRDPRLSFR